MISKDLNNTIIGAAYARTRYEGRHNANKLQCSTYTTPAIHWTAITDAACPSDASMCVSDKVYKPDTGMVNTHTGFGINWHHSARVNFLECHHLCSYQAARSCIDCSVDWR